MFKVKWLWKYMGRKRWIWAQGLVLSGITSALVVVNAMLSQWLIDEVITAGLVEKLLPILGIMMLTQMTRLSLRYLMVVCVEVSSQSMIEDVRKRIYNVVQNEDYRFFGRLRTGDIMTRMTNDLDLVRHAIAWISYAIVDCIVLFTVTIVYLFTVNVKFTLALAAITPFILIVTRVYSKIINPMYVQLRSKLSKLNTVAQENIAGNRVVKAFAREEFEKEKFEEKNEDFRQYNLKTTFTWLKFYPIIEFLSQSLTVITLLLGGIFMINEELTAGELMAFSSLTWALANPLRTLGMVLNDVQRFFASCDMIIELFYSQPTIVDRQNAITPTERLKGKVEFRNVSFSINGATLLDDVSFVAEPGTTVGVMGATGAGKTSLLNMIDRFYEATAGEVLIDDLEISRYTLSSLRSSVGFAMQDVFLFSDTVEGNIAYGEPEMSFEEVVAFAKTARADKFIRNMEEGYDTIVGERGVGLSGGQRQRIALARALAMKPPILMLDDTTSAVDMETEQYIQEQLRSLPFSCTKIIVAQRVSSVQDADQILIMDEGRIIERGTHAELLQKKGYYYNIWALQNSVSEGGDDLGAQ